MAEYIDKKQLDRKFIMKMLAPTTSTIFDVKDIIDELPTADVVERSKIDKAKSNIEIMLEQEKQKDGTYTDVGQGIAIALGLLNNEIGE